MLRLRSFAAAVVFVAVAVAAQAKDYHPSFRPGTLKGPPAGAPNEVLVLGTTHLSGLGKEFSPALLALLLDRLAAWRPTLIATEDLSGLQCDALRRYPSRYAETVKTYCFDPAAAGRAVGLDVPAANAEAERLLAAWPASPTSAQRRRLAAVFLAAGERGSALVQWLRLPPGDRRIGDGIDADLVTILSKFADRHNETGLIAAALAARLGLERVWSVDDHSADTPDDTDPATQKAAEAAIARAWANPATAERAAADKRLEAGIALPGGILALYRAMNTRDAPQLA